MTRSLRVNISEPTLSCIAGLGREARVGTAPLRRLC